MDKISCDDGDVRKSKFAPYWRNLCHINFVKESQKQFVSNQIKLKIPAIIKEKNMKTLGKEIF